MKSKSETYREPASRFAEKFRSRFAYDDDRSLWRVFDGNVWRRAGVGDGLKWEAAGVLEAMGYSNGRDATMWTLDLAEGMMARPFGSRSRVIPFRNVILDCSDLADWKILSHGPDESAHWCLDYDWEAGDDYLIHDDWTLLFTYATTGCVQERVQLMTFIGRAALGDESLQQAVLLIGPPGGGKSTFLEGVLSLLGHNSSDGAVGELFKGDDTGANLRYDHLEDRITVVDEFPADAIARDENVFKRMVTHQSVRSKKLYKDTGEHHWRSMLLFSSNDMPRFPDGSGAVRRRLYTVKWREAIPEKDRDPLFPKRLDGERAQFLNACLLLACEAIISGRTTLDECAHTIEFGQEVASEGDPVKDWVREQCLLSPDAEQQIQEMWGAFNRWKQLNGEDKRGGIGRGKLVKSLLGYEPYKLRKEKRGSKNFLVGISLLREIIQEIEAAEGGFR